MARPGGLGLADVDSKHPHSSSFRPGCTRVGYRVGTERKEGPVKDGNRSTASNLARHRATQPGEQTRLSRGRFEAVFGDNDAARAAARDARSAGFAVDPPRETAQGWLIVGRPKLPFPEDERDRDASRLRTIATHHQGALHGVTAAPVSREDDSRMSDIT